VLHLKFDTANVYERFLSLKESGRIVYISDRKYVTGMNGKRWDEWVGTKVCFYGISLLSTGSLFRAIGVIIRLVTKKRDIQYRTELIE